MINTDSMSNEIVNPLVRTDEDEVMQAFLKGTAVKQEIANRVQERSRLIREAISRQHGLVEISVPAIRELRGPLA